jgi:hypothetical protein
VGNPTCIKLTGCSLCFLGVKSIASVTFTVGFLFVLLHVRNLIISVCTVIRVHYTVFH